MMPQRGLSQRGYSDSMLVYFFLNGCMTLISLLIVLSNAGDSVPGYAQQLVLAVQLILIGSAALASQAGAGDVQRVLLARAAPLSALQSRLDRLWWVALRCWMLSCVPLLVMGLSQSIFTPADTLNETLIRLSSGPGLLALVMMLGVALAALWQGRLPWQMALVVLALFFSAAATWAWGGMAAWTAGGWPLHGLLMLTLAPVLRRLLQLPAKSGAMAATPSPQLWLRSLVRRWRAHWHFLEPMTQRGAAIGPVLIGLQSSSLWLTDSGGTSGMSYVMRMTLLTVAASGLLQARDLHWRRLLAPGGGQRRRLGWHVLKSSLIGNLQLLGLLALPLLATALWLRPTEGQQLLASMPMQSLSLLGDVLLATTIAATLRGFTGGHGINIVIILSVMLLCLLGQHLGVSWQRQHWHMLANYGLSLALLPLLQRAWLKTDLIRLAARMKS